MSDTTHQYLAETEVIFRAANQNIADFIVEEEGEDTPTTLPFYCECSNEDCRERIRMRPQTYRELHKNKRQFVAKPGHNVPEIEKVVKEQPELLVIEKFGDPPRPEDIGRTLKTLRI